MKVRSDPLEARNGSGATAAPPLDRDLGVTIPCFSTVRPFRPGHASPIVGVSGGLTDATPHFRKSNRAV